MNQKTNTKSQTSVPRNPPKLQPGRSSLYWYGMVIKVNIIVFIAIAALLMIVYWLPVGNPVRSPLILFVVAIEFILAILLGIITIGVSKADRREKKAGYTTTYDYRKRDLWQLDPDTGEVIHRPGDPIPKRRK